MFINRGVEVQNFFITHLFAAIFLVSAIRAAPTVSDTLHKEIRWEEAAGEVDSFRFSGRFVDSVFREHDVPMLKEPLRILKKEIFCVPETLVYNVGWGPFNAGYVVITTIYDSTRNVVEIGAKALSNNFVSAFYRMRDYVISTLDPVGLYPLFFEQHLREGRKYRADEYLLFDHVGGKVHAQSKSKFETREAPPFTQDYLSVLYAIRANRTLTPGDTFSEPIFVHSKVHSMFFSVKASEKRTVTAGEFQCFLLVPRLVGEGRAFNKRDKLEIWFSDDKRRLPVMVKSKIKFGSIHAQLVWYNTNFCSAGPPKG